VPGGGERLQKVLAHAGFASRRVCEQLIASGRVTIDGKVAEIGRRVDRETVRIAVDGVPVVVDPSRVYYLLNKPSGVVCTARDPQGRRTVVEMVPSEPRVFPVGRLDYTTEGLIVLTNDGGLTHALTHPSRGVEKEYLVEVEGEPGAAAVRALREGVLLDDGRTAPSRARVVQRHGGNAALVLVIHEGRNRQVRRMCNAVGHPVLRLVRTRIGPLSDRSLRPGRWRPLAPTEVAALHGAALGVRSPGAGDRAGGD